MAQTTRGVTWNFQEDALAKGMLFLSNHRDIVLDPSLVNVALMDHGRKATEIGIGSNFVVVTLGASIGQVEQVLCCGAIWKRT